MGHDEMKQQAVTNHAEKAVELLRENAGYIEQALQVYKNNPSDDTARAVIQQMIDADSDTASNRGRALVIANSVGGIQPESWEDGVDTE